MDAEPSCAAIAAKNGGVMAQDVVVNDNGTLRYVLVYVKEGLNGQSYKPIEASEKLDQYGCLYNPHVVALVAGENLKITKHRRHDAQTFTRCPR